MAVNADAKGVAAMTMAPYSLYDMPAYTPTPPLRPPGPCTISMSVFSYSASLQPNQAEQATATSKRCLSFCPQPVQCLLGSMSRKVAV